MIDTSAIARNGLRLFVDMNSAPLLLFQSFSNLFTYLCKPYHRILCNRTIAKTLCQRVFNLKKKRFVDIFLCSHFCHIPQNITFLYMVLLFFYIFVVLSSLQKMRECVALSPTLFLGFLVVVPHRS